MIRSVVSFTIEINYENDNHNLKLIYLREYVAQSDLLEQHKNNLKSISVIAMKSKQGYFLSLEHNQATDPYFHISKSFCFILVAASILQPRCDVHITRYLLFGFIFWSYYLSFICICKCDAVCFRSAQCSSSCNLTNY